MSVTQLNIDVKIAGADEAAGKLKKVEQAADSVGKKAGGATGLFARFEEGVKSLDDAVDKVEKNGKSVVIWKYARPAHGGPAQAGAPGALSAPFGYPGFGPNPSHPLPMLHSEEFFKVEFENGKVARWDLELQDDPELRDLKIPAPLQK